ncbi:suppressor of cytokine signaling 2 isoform 1-T4 [Menidia menidia]
MTCQSAESPEGIQDQDQDQDPVQGGHRPAHGGGEETEEGRVASAMKELQSTGWYWGSLTASQAKQVLQDSCEGSFLLRDSSQRDYLFTISAMTSAGPTNLRIRSRGGLFQLDSVLLVQPRLRSFPSVVRLVEHYVKLSRAGGGGRGPGGGAGPNGGVQLLLTRPVYAAAPPLQHLCRTAINRSTGRPRDLPIPPRLQDYLLDYRYSV